MVAAHYRIAADPAQLVHELGINTPSTGSDGIVRAAKRLGLKARQILHADLKRLMVLPLPAIASLKNGEFAIVGVRRPDGRLRIGFPSSSAYREMTIEEFDQLWSGEIVLLARRLTGPGVNPSTFGFRWFLASIWRYRRPL